MQAFPSALARPTRRLGFLTPFAVVVGVVVLLLLPNLIMHASPGHMSGSLVPVQDHAAASQSAAAAMASPIVR
jgi:hypothetical protein